MLLYDLGLLLYRQGVRIAALTDNVKARQLNVGLDSVWTRLNDFAKKDAEKKTLWIHAASLGEFEQGRPLIEMIRRNRSDYKILLTFFSPSGYEVRKNYKEVDGVCYLPIDTPRNARRFLDIVKPDAAIFVKYEFWLNYLAELKKRGIPTYLISGIFRPGQLFFKPYGSFYRKALNAFTHLYIQDEGSKRLLEGIGYRNTTVAGDTRFDRVTDIMLTAKPHTILDRFCCDAATRKSKRPLEDRPLIFIAGSSWPQDEAVYASWLRDHKNVKGIIAPHEFDAERLAKLKQLFSGDAILLSEAEKNPENIDDKKVLIIDCFGLLASAYTYGDIAYVGGGFGAGMHNINEAAVYAIPVFYGPNNAKFIEAQEMKTCGGGLEVTSQADFESKISSMLADRADFERRGLAAGAYIRSKLGATNKIFSDLFS